MQSNSAVEPSSPLPSSPANIVRSSIPTQSTPPAQQTPVIGGAGGGTEGSGINVVLKSGTLVKGKWKIDQKIGQGTFGVIYSGKDVVTGESVAIKVEPVNSKRKVLKLEVSVLKRLQSCQWVVPFITCGRQGEFNYMVMELLGDNIATLRRKQPDGRFSMQTTTKLGMQMLKAIEAIHDLGYLHRDIKASNFAMGLRKDHRKTTFMIDFGLARKYVLPNGEVAPSRAATGFRGTARYASIHSHDSMDLGRRDDLWSLFYVLLEFINGALPWSRVREKEAVGEMKRKAMESGSLEKELIGEAPAEFFEWLQHLKSLGYADRPHYSLLYSLLEKVYHRSRGENGGKNGEISEEFLYDWELRELEEESLQGRMLVRGVRGLRGPRGVTRRRGSRGSYFSKRGKYAMMPYAASSTPHFLRASTTGALENAQGVLSAQLFVTLGIMSLRDRCMVIVVLDLPSYIEKLRALRDQSRSLQEGSNSEGGSGADNNPSSSRSSDGEAEEDPQSGPTTQDLPRDHEGSTESEEQPGASAKLKKKKKSGKKEKKNGKSKKKKKSKSKRKNNNNTGRKPRKRPKPMRLSSDLQQRMLEFILRIRASAASLSPSTSAPIQFSSTSSVAASSSVTPHTSSGMFPSGTPSSTQSTPSSSSTTLQHILSPVGERLKTSPSNRNLHSNAFLAIRNFSVRQIFDILLDPTTLTTLDLTSCMADLRVEDYLHIARTFGNVRDLRLGLAHSDALLRPFLDATSRMPEVESSQNHSKSTLFSPMSSITHLSFYCGSRLNVNSKVVKWLVHPSPLTQTQLSDPPKFQKISIRGSDRLTDKSVELILKRCPSLKELDLHGCKKIHGNFAKLLMAPPPPTYLLASSSAGEATSPPNAIVSRSPPSFRDLSWVSPRHLFASAAAVRQSSRLALRHADTILTGDAHNNINNHSRHSSPLAVTPASAWALESVDLSYCEISKKGYRLLVKAFSNYANHPVHPLKNFSKLRISPLTTAPNFRMTPTDLCVLLRSLGDRLTLLDLCTFNFEMDDVLEEIYRSNHKLQTLCIEGMGITDMKVGGVIEGCKAGIEILKFHSITLPGAGHNGTANFATILDKLSQSLSGRLKNLYLDFWGPRTSRSPDTGSPLNNSPVALQRRFSLSRSRPSDESDKIRAGGVLVSAGNSSLASTSAQSRMSRKSEAENAEEEEIKEENALRNFLMTCGPKLEELSLPHCPAITEHVWSAWEEGDEEYEEKEEKSSGREGGIAEIFLPALRVLNLSECSQVNDECVRRIVECCPGLRSLNLKGVNGLTGLSLVAIAIGLPDLEELNLRQCSCFLDDEIRKLLRKLPKLFVKVTRYTDFELRGYHKEAHSTTVDELFTRYPNTFRERAFEKSLKVSAYGR